MMPLDYATPKAPKPTPLLGRVSASCICIGIYSFFFGSRLRYGPKTWIDWVTPLCVLLFFGIAFATSVVAVARRRSRTRLAWISFSISIALWAFILYVLEG